MTERVETLISKEEIEKKIQSLAEQIMKDYAVSIGDERECISFFGRYYVTDKTVKTLYIYIWEDFKNDRKS